MVIDASTKMMTKVLMVALSRAIEARSVKHRGEKRKFHFGMAPRHDSSSAAGAFWARRAVRWRPALKSSPKGPKVARMDAVRNESDRPDLNPGSVAELRRVLGSSVWSTRTFARWAAG
jgi:hypothetical protein